MKYIAPAMQLEEAMAAMMIAESLKINKDSDKTVDGEDALTNANDAWDIWGDD